MSARLRLAIVGCGAIAAHMAHFARLNPRLKLAACCDSDGERAQAFARRHHISQAYSEYAALLEQPGLQAVYLATPHHLHASMLQAALERGLPVLCEKPVTRTLAEGREICRLAAERNIPLAVNYQYRYDSGCYALARAAQRGDLGTIHYARINIPWHREKIYFSAAAWHARLAAAGGGTLITQGSHLLDVVLWAISSHPISASGYTAQRVFKEVEVEDIAQGVIELESGVLVQITSAMIAASEQAVSIELYGDQATAIYRDRPRPNVRFIGRHLGRRIVQEAPPTWGLHALGRSLEGFRRWACGGPPHLAPAGDTLATLAAVEAFYRSARNGQRAPVLEP